MPPDFETLVYGPIFSEFGREATYTPPDGGADDAVACVIIRDKQDVELGIAGIGRPVMQGDLVKVRVSEVAVPAKRGEFRIGAEVLRIVDDPRCDESERLVWTMTVQSRSS